MKQFLSITGFLAAAVLLTSAISIKLSPQDPPGKQKKEKHIKMVKVTDDGKKIELDTVIGSNEVFIWKGDTMSAPKIFSTQLNAFEIDEKGGENVFIMKSGMHSASHSVKLNGDSCAHIKLLSAPIKNHCKMMHGNMHGATKMVVVGNHEKKNIIDLSDPGIISFEKKELKDGKEKITIIREKPSEEAEEIHEEIMIHGAGSHPVFIHEGGVKANQIKVFASDDGKIEIIEDGKVWNIEEGDQDVKVIEEDGKKIIIKKKNIDNKMEVEVEVEEELEEEK